MRARIEPRQGFALVSVIIVLAALAVIATPFAISMRNHSKTSAVTSAASRVRLGAEGARNHAVHVLARSHPGTTFDATPRADTLDELRVDDWESLSLDVRDPRGDLWSARAEDEQGKANLTSVSPILLGNLLGGTTLSQEVGAEAGSLRVDDASAFPERGGLLFVGGEVIRYERRTGSGFEGCVRGEFYNLGWFREPLEHAAGTSVVSFKAWEAAAYRSRKSSGQLSELASIWSLREVPFAGGPEPQAWSLPEIETLEEDVTVASKRLVGRGWINPQALLQPVSGGVQGGLTITNGRYYGPGTTIKVTDGRVTEYSIVTSVEPRGQQAWQLYLETPLGESFDAETTRVWALARHPVNVNTASARLLIALVTGLRSGGGSSGDVIDRATANRFVERLIAARLERGLDSHEDLYRRVLEPANDEGALSDSQMRAIYSNALHPGDSQVGGGTAGFCYESYGTFRIEATAVSNARSGLERGRHTIDQVVNAVPQADLLKAWVTQRDFEDQIVASRASRYFLTGPISQHRFEGFNVPPSRVPVNLGFERFPSQNPEEGYVQLEPVRKFAPNGVFVEHFDNDRDPEGRDLLETTYSVGPGTSDRGPASWVGQFGVVPYAIDLWYRPEGAGGPIFDSGINDLEGRLSLRVDGSELILQVADNVLDDPRTNWPEIGEVRWTIPSGMEANTWYHVGASWRGSRPSDLTMTVDGVPRGERRGLTRLSGGLSDLTSLAPLQNPGNQQGGQTVINANVPGALPELEERIPVVSTEGFPPMGVVRIGNEIIEYNGVTGNALITTVAREQRGGRGARGTLAAARAHPTGATVEQYGYSTAISSPILPRNGNLPAALGLPDIGILRGETELEDPVTKVPLGLGLGMEDKQLLMRSPIPESPDSRIFMEAFSQQGGVVLVLSSYAGIDRRGFTNQLEMTIGGQELMRYSRADWGSGTLSGLERWGDLNHYYETGEFRSTGEPSVDSIFIDEETWEPKGWRIRVNNQNVAAFSEGDYTVVIPLSVGVAGLASDTLLDPEQTGRPEERMQIGTDESTEWVRYDSVQTRDGWVTRNDSWILGQIRTNIYTDTSLRTRSRAEQVPPNEQGRGVEIKPRISLKDEIFERHVEDELRFRGQYGTLPRDHAANALVLPVFRAWKTGRITARPGRGDWVTVITPNGSREGNVINWAWTADDPSDQGDQAESYFAFVQVGVDVHIPTEQTGANGQQRGLSQMDSREITRLVKFPSGELSVETGAQMEFGALYNGSGAVAAMIDEVEFRRFEDPVRQRANSRYRLIQDISEEEQAFRVAEDSVEVNHVDSYGIRSVTSRLFAGGGVLQIGEELIVYETVSPGSGDFEIAEDGRGFLLTEPVAHTTGERLVYLPQFRVTTLAQTLRQDDSEIAVVDASQFPDAGMVLIGTEVIAYVRKPNNQLLQLAREVVDPDGTSSDERGLLRGRFGTAPTEAESGSVVYLLPFRYWDRYQARSDHPELSYFQSFLGQPRAFWRSLTWKEEIPEPQFMDLLVMVRIAGKAAWDEEPNATPYLRLFDRPAEAQNRNELMVQGDDLELRVFVEFKPGAFDSETFLANAWKKTPRLHMVGIDYIAPSHVESHVETR